MKKMRIIAAVLVVVAGIAIGVSWFLTRPMYSPGGLAEHPSLDPAAGANAERWLVDADTELAHFAAGNGRNVLFVHGGPGIPLIESAPAFDLLGDSYRFHYYDQRGTGKSTRPITGFETTSMWANVQTLNDALGIEAQLADIERIRRILGDEQLILVGHSYGAFLAALYAAELPERVDKLVLIAPADLLVLPAPDGGLFEAVRERLPESEWAAYDDWQARYLDMAGIFELDEAGLAALDAEFIGYYTAAAGPLPLGAAGEPGAWHSRAQYISMGMRHDYSGALGSIVAPALIVHGAEDLQPLAVSQSYQNSIDSAQLATIEDAGHFPQFTHADELARILREFL